MIENVFVITLLVQNKKQAGCDNNTDLLIAKIIAQQTKMSKLSHWMNHQLMHLHLLQNHAKFREHFYKCFLLFLIFYCSKSIFQLFRHIIIMLHQKGNQIFGNNYHKQLVKFCNETKQQISQQANRLKQRQQIPKNQQKIEVQCKKEIKHYLNCLRKNPIQMKFNKESKWLNIVYRLFGKKDKRQNEQRQIYQSGNMINFEAITIINKPLNNYHFLIFLLSFRTMKSINQEKYIDVELISLQGKIIYKKVNLKNYQEIHEQILKVKNSSSDILMLIQNRIDIINSFESNMQLSNLLDQFHDVQRNQEFLKVGLTQQQIQFNQIISCIIQKFQLIKQSLKQIIEPSTQKYLSLDQIIALTFVHNIVQTICINPHKSLRSQMKPYESIIGKLLEKESLESQSRNIRPLPKDHFPSTLQNAHHCRRCKDNRGYISCISCSKNEGKNISLCLNCYQSHHSDYKQTISVVKEQALSILYKWENVDLQVQLMNL